MPPAFRPPRSDADSGVVSASPQPPARSPLSTAGPRRFTARTVMSPLGTSAPAAGAVSPPWGASPAESPRHRRFSVDPVLAAEAASHADVAADLLDTATTGHTWHGHVAAERWRNVQRDRQRTRDDIEAAMPTHTAGGVASPERRGRISSTATATAWLPSRPSSTESPMDAETAREVASSVDVADDLLGTSRASRFRAGPAHPHPHPHPHLHPHPGAGAASFRGHATPRSPAFGGLPQMGGGAARGGGGPHWRGGFAAAHAAPPAREAQRPPRTLAGLFGPPSEDEDESEDDEGMLEDDMLEEGWSAGGQVVDAEQHWLNTIAARHRLAFGDAPERVQHSWHGADHRLAEGWSQVLRARQMGSPPPSDDPCSPQCGR